MHQDTNRSEETTQEDISSEEVNRRILILIDALLQGHRLQYHRWVICLNSAYQVCSIGYDWKGNENGKLLPFNFGKFTLTDFMEWAEDLSSDELDVIIANIALNKVGKNDRR